MTNLLTFYEGWDNHQRLLVAMIKPVTMDQLSLRPAPHMWTLYTLAAHIIATRIWWFHNWMGEGSADLEHALGWDEEGQPIRSADELIDMLNQSWAMIETSLSRWTESDLGQSFKNPLYKDRPSHQRT